ncbi:MAG: ATP-binding cassette domain-containing protein [Deltaproteobacteria bacterium]|nr:ATP-binding cassette domain-containing protein [Deltaproteobacteria bacterium]
METGLHEDNKPLITLSDVTLRRGDRMLLPGTSWEIRSGENWAILGPNGSGKSALAQAIRGDVPYVRGKLIRHDPSAQGHRIGYVSFELQEELLVREERRDEARAFSGRGRGLTAGELLRENDGDPAALKRVTDALDLHPLLNQGFRTLSNGEVRKLLIARALLPSPKLLILDDPFAGLDAGSRRSLADAVTRLMEEGTQILLVAQRPEEVMPGISHVLLIQDGRVALTGKRAEVLTPARVELLQGKGEAAAPLEPPRLVKTMPLPPGEPLVEMKNVHVAYGETVVLDGLNWTVRRGENWAVIGPNGSGKSTLLSLITGDNLQVYANEVCLFGKRRGEGESVWSIRQKIGVVSPELQLRYRKPGTVREIVLSGFFDSIGLYRNPDAGQEDVADGWLKALGMEEKADRPFFRLSYGEKRLALIVRAMVKSPELLILDEPCQGLDGVNRARVLSLMEGIGAGTETGLIYVTHHEEEMIPSVHHVLRLERRRRGVAGTEPAPEDPES